MVATVEFKTLKRFSPLSDLSETRLLELASLCYIEQVEKHQDPFRTRGIAGQSVFLTRGELALERGGGASPEVLVGGSMTIFWT